MEQSDSAKNPTSHCSDPPFSSDCKYPLLLLDSQGSTEKEEVPEGGVEEWSSEHAM